MQPNRQLARLQKSCLCAVKLTTQVLIQPKLAQVVCKKISRFSKANSIGTSKGTDSKLTFLNAMLPVTDQNRNKDKLAATLHRKNCKNSITGSYRANKSTAFTGNSFPTSISSNTR